MSISLRYLYYVSIHDTDDGSTDNMAANNNLGTYNMAANNNLGTYNRPHRYL
jgi:hypothetical protein